MLGGAPIYWCSIKEVMVALTFFEVVCISTPLKCFSSNMVKESRGRTCEVKCNVVTIKVDKIPTSNIAKKTNCTWDS